MYHMQACCLCCIIDFHRITGTTNEFIWFVILFFAGNITYIPMQIGIFFAINRRLCDL